MLLSRLTWADLLICTAIALVPAVASSGQEPMLAKGGQAQALKFARSTASEGRRA